MCFYGFHVKKKAKIFLQNMFHTILNNSINKKKPSKRKKKPKAVKDRGRARVGLTAKTLRQIFTHTSGTSLCVEKSDITGSKY